MSQPGTQVLLPPERFSSSHSTDQPGHLRWLFAPIEGRMFLPLAGLWILGLDWLLFPPEAATVGLATPVASLLGFVLGSTGVYRMQRQLALDSKREAIGKALLAGFIVGLPFSLAGTVVGAWIVASSGLLHLRDRLFGRRK
jgi:hypothetical protein